MTNQHTGDPFIINNEPTTPIEYSDLTTQEPTIVETTGVSAPQEQFDPVKFIKELSKVNPKFASKLWYKLHNTPGTVKTLNGTTYVISPTGAWVKQN